MLLQALHRPIYQRRIEVLTGLILDHLQPGDRVLDVGSGNGVLGQALQLAGSHLDGLAVSGIEKNPRGGEMVPTVGFDGYSIPAEDGAFEVTILADVVHHEEEPERLLREVARVTKRIMIIKDHVASGLLAYPRICFMDWAANKPYGVECLYRYFSASEWREIYQGLGLTIRAELERIDLYPPLVNTIFGKRLQYFCVVGK